MLTKWITIVLIFLLQRGILASDQDVTVLERYNVDEINADLDLSAPTVDIVIHHVKNAEVSWADLLRQINFAKKVFESVGVQLRLAEATMINVPPHWLDIVGMIPSGDPSKFEDDLDFYDEVRQERATLSSLASEVFSSIIEKHTHNFRTIHVITLVDVKLSYYEKNMDDKWEYNSISTGGLAFSPYTLEDRVAMDLRGVITIQSVRDAGLAHELGHKLINVSHEGSDVCPQFSGVNIPGLLGHEGETQIYGGAAGRWHRERLHKSPFIYRLVNGKRIWNPNFHSNGRYDDPIYGNFVVKPACNGRTE